MPSLVRFAYATLMALRNQHLPLALQHFHDGDDVRPHFLKWPELIAHRCDIHNLVIPAKEFLWGSLPEFLSKALSDKI